LPANAQITYSLQQILQSAAWQYEVKALLQVITNQTQIKLELPPFNRTELEATKTQIEEETGTISGNYSLQIVPIFTVNANTSAGPIHQTFSPVLTIEVGRTEQGNTITVENLHQQETDAITENVIVTHNEVTYERYASYIFLAFCLIGLGFSAFRYSKAHASTKGSGMDKLIVPYKDLVIEAKEVPEFSEDTPIIEVKDLEELAKAAEILARPIFYIHNDAEHTFYVFDADMTYIYRKTEGKT
jgi:hypothetical protein